ncbi:MAG TPA: ATP synthase subunit I, partial [Methanothrix soehngenii]|nr:ATP synthase subunit I [Methanothrix soehngenii]
MNSAFTLPASFFLGAVLSAFYFGGLWLTVKRLPRSRQPTLLSLSSFAARSLICLMGFYLVMGQGIEA